MAPFDFWTAAFYYFVGVFSCYIFIRMLNYVPVLRVFEFVNFTSVYLINYLSKETEAFNFRGIDLDTWRNAQIKHMVDLYPPSMRKVLGFTNWAEAHKWLKLQEKKNLD